MKEESLIWVYPTNKWTSEFNKTFIYGWSNPKTKLFVSINDSPLKRVNLFSNGNFAQTISLPKGKNIVKLIQLLKNKQRTIIRNVSVKDAVKTRGFMSLQKAKQQSNAIPINAQYSMLNPKSSVIIIDPGHGGKEHGTHSPKGIPESRFNLEISKLLYKKLKKNYNHVFLTRTKDKFISLKQRVGFAKNKDCNVLISMHHNALPDNEDPLKHKGIGIYYTHDFSKPFAKLLLLNISKASGLKPYGFFKRDFALTKPDFCIAVLIECGFLIHPVESEYITKPKAQKKIVQGIIKGLKASRLLK